MYIITEIKDPRKWVFFDQNYSSVKAVYNQSNIH